MFVLFCTGNVFWWLVQRGHTSCGSLNVCDLEASKMKQPRPDLGCYATKAGNEAFWFMLETLSSTTTTNLLIITLHRSRSSVIGKANTIRAGQPAFESWQVKTGCRDHLASYSVGTIGNGVLSREWSGWDVKLTIHLHLVLKLRMSGALPLFPLYDLMECTGKTLSLLH